MPDATTTLQFAEDLIRISVQKGNIPLDGLIETGIVVRTGGSLVKKERLEFDIWLVRQQPKQRCLVLNGMAHNIRDTDLAIHKLAAKNASVDLTSDRGFTFPIE